MSRFFLVVFVVLAGCSPTRIETDYGGNGDYIIINRSTALIRVEITKVSQLGGGTDTSGIIRPDSSKAIFSDAIIGCNVTPQKSLTAMKIYKDSSGTTILLYTQDPIDQSKWIIEKQYSGDFGHTKNTFTFYDSLVTR